MGLQGLTGNTGPKGDKGDIGDDGDKGDKGDSGLSTATYTFYYPRDDNKSDNEAMYMSNIRDMDESTLENRFMDTDNQIAPHQILETINLNSAVTTIASAAIKTSPILYPVYAFIGLYRVDYTSRKFLGLVEVQINAPSGGRAVGINNNLAGAGLLGTGSGSTDGIYTVNRFLVPATPTPISPGLNALVQQASITLNIGWYVGAELLNPISQPLGLSRFEIPELGSTYSYSSPRGYASSIGRYRNTTITLKMQ